jgi:uncharacterized protein (DUF433 family)
MTILEQHPLSIAVPLREDPPGILRVGKSRVLLELVIHAHEQGESPERIVEMYPDLDLGDVFAVIAYYLAHESAVIEYLRRIEQQAADVRQLVEARQPPGPTKQELLSRAAARGLKP